MYIYISRLYVYIYIYPEKRAETQRVYGGARNSSRKRTHGAAAAALRKCLMCTPSHPLCCCPLFWET